METLTLDEKNTVREIVILCSFFSAVAGTLVLITYAIFKDLFKNNLCICIFYLTIPNVIDAVASILSAAFFLNNPTVCSALGFLIIYSIYASSAWLILISNTVYTIAKSNSHRPRMDHRTYIYYLLFGFVVPLVPAIIGLSQGWLGNDNDISCGTYDLTSIGYFGVHVYSVIIPRGLTFLTIVYFYSLAAYHLRGASDAEESKRICWQTLLFPLAYFISSSMFIVNSVTTEQYFLVSLLGWGLRRSIGVFDAIIYGVNPFVRMQIKATLRRRRELLLLHP